MDNNIDLELYAEDLERDARNEKDFSKKAKLYLSAANTWKEAGNKKGSSYNLSKYHQIEGNICFHKNEFDNAIKHYKEAERLFIGLNMRKDAFLSAGSIIRTYDFKMHQDNFDEYELYFKKCIRTLDRYKKCSTVDKVGKREWPYFNIKISYYTARSKFCAENRNYKLACEYDKKRIEYAEDIYSKYKYPRAKEIITKGNASYWLRKTNLLRQEIQEPIDNLKVAEAYKNAAEFFKETNNIKTSNHCYSDYYKHLAFAYPDNREAFLENIEEAEEFSKKCNNEKQVFFLEGLKHSHFAKSSYNFEERIENLKFAKENFFKSGDKRFAIDHEFLLQYTKYQKYLKEGNYKKAISYLDETIDRSEKVKFPNIFPNKQALIDEKEITRAYYKISTKNFKAASKLLGNWLHKSEDINETKKYKVFDFVKTFMDILSKKRFTNEDLHEIQGLYSSIENKHLGPYLLEVNSLIQAYISLNVNKIQNVNLEPIILKIIEKLTTEKIANDLKKALELQKAIREREWLRKLPIFFEEQFEKNVYFMNDITEEFMDSAFTRFYKLLEKYLSIIVEFNAKIIWRENWRDFLEDNFQKKFDSFTLGNYIDAIIKIRDEGSPLCDKSISNDLFMLLQKHMEIRNKLTHEFSFKEGYSKEILLNEIPQIMYLLHHSFPLCFRVKNDTKKPHYHITLLWNLYPKEIPLYFNNGYLKKDCIYYTEPHQFFDERDNKRMHPEILITGEEISRKIFEEDTHDDLIFVNIKIKKEK